MKPAPCKRCGAVPTVKQVGDETHIQCDGSGCALMFLISQEGYTPEQTIEVWDKMMAEYGVSWSY